MRKFIFFLFFLLVAAYVGMQVAKDPGYLLLVYGHWSVEMPLWLGGVLVLCLVLLVYVLCRTGWYFSGHYRRLSHWLKRRQQNRYYLGLVNAMLALIVGEVSKAGRLALRDHKQAQKPMVHCLLAAKAFQAQGLLEKRDHYLAQARKANPGEHFVIDLFHAKLLVAAKQYPEALVMLKRLISIHTHHATVICLLAKVYEQTGDWRALVQLLPKLERSGKQTPTEWQAYVQQTAMQLLTHSQPEVLKANFILLPKEARVNSSVVCAYVDQLLAGAQDSDAEKMLHEILVKQWDDRFMPLLCRSKISPKRLFSYAKRWLVKYPHNASLHALMAISCVRQSLLVSARDYFEKSLSLQPNPAIYAAYADCLLQLNDKAQALAMYQKAYAG